MPKKTPKRLKFKFRKLREKLNGFEIDIYTTRGHEYPTPNGMPATVKISGAEYEIRYHSHIYATPHASARLMGMVMYGLRTIFIDPIWSIHEMRESLYHEIAHVYLHNWQQKKGSLAKLTPEQIEEFCDLFAEGFYDACKANPGLTG